MLSAPETEKFFLNSDKHRLEQVLINLISNAIKFTQTGAIEIGYRDKEGNFIEFFVKDTGIGISPEMRELI
jgi:signal transduction histidine kinase